MEREAVADRATILVAEDDPAIREAIELLLREEGYAVLAAADGFEALELVRHGRPGLLLIDLGMPRLDGAGFCRAYRADGGDAPVIVLSAANPSEVEEAARACGAVAYIRKPFDVDEVLRTVARHLRDGRTSQA